MQRAVFIDRDGVINAMVYHPDFGLIDSPANPDEFRVLPGVGEAVKRINNLGFLAIVISNQPGVAKGKFTMELLEATRQKMLHEIAEWGGRLDAIYYCLHHPQAMVDSFRVICDCRKPKPGLLFQAAEEWNVVLQKSFLIGDGISDIVAGRDAGCKTFLVNSRKCYICDELARQAVEPDFIARDLADAVETISRMEETGLPDTDRHHFRCKLSCD